MQKITPFLWFNDQAEEAAKFYCSVFKNSKILSIDRPGKDPRGKAIKIVTFRLDGQELIALDGGPQFKFSPAISLYVRCKTQQEVDHYWQKLLKGGDAIQCGWLKDKYGLCWQIVPNTLVEFLNGKDRAKAARVMQAMLKMIKIDIKALKKAAKDN